MDAILWYATWPVVVYIAYRFVLLNLEHHKKMERLAQLEEAEMARKTGKGGDAA
ncbi:hypothetical protein [Hydrogenimonas sp.]